MAEDQVLTATTASRSFSELLHRVCYGGESFVIKKGSRIMARMVPVEIKTESAPMEEAPAALPSITSDDAEFYRAWMEQVRKIET